MENTDKTSDEWMIKPIGADCVGLELTYGQLLLANMGVKRRNECIIRLIIISKQAYLYSTLYKN